jgi:secreted protein acidic and rich in cysteine
LESCDKNNDHRITMLEWGVCLGLEDGDLADKCDELLNLGKDKANEV